MGSDSNQRKRILILGSGFGGLYTALHLEKKLRRETAVEITLVNRENFFLFTPMLHEVAAGDLDFEDLAGGEWAGAGEVSVGGGPVAGVGEPCRGECGVAGAGWDVADGVDDDVGGGVGVDADGAGGGEFGEDRVGVDAAGCVVDVAAGGAWLLAVVDE